MDGFANTTFAPAT